MNRTAGLSWKKRGIVNGALIVIGFTFVGSVPLRASAPNMIANGDFDTGIETWITSSPDIHLNWADIDHASCPSGISRAAEALHLASAGDQLRAVATCVTGIVPGALYSFGAELRFETGQARTGTAEILVVWLSSGDCTGFMRGNPPFGDPPVNSSSAGQWISVRNAGAIAPSNSQSASFVIRLQKLEAGGELALQVDGAYFAPFPGFLFADGFDRASACYWSATDPN